MSESKPLSRLRKLFRRCRCFHFPLGAGVMERVPLKVCPKHGDRATYRDLEHFLEQQAVR